MMAEFNMAGLRLLNFYRRLKVIHSVDEIFISQDNYTLTYLRNSNMLNCKTCSTPINMYKVIH